MLYLTRAWTVSDVLAVLAAGKPRKRVAGLAASKHEVSRVKKPLETATSPGHIKLGQVISASQTFCKRSTFLNTHGKIRALFHPGQYQT